MSSKEIRFCHNCNDFPTLDYGKDNKNGRWLCPSCGIFLDTGIHSCDVEEE